MSKERNIILITGGYSGIGQGIAKELASAGEIVIVTTRKRVNLLIEGPEYIGENIWGIEMDVLQQESIEKAIKECEQFIGVPNVLINNAGVYTRESILNYSREEWNVTIDTNLTAVFFVSQFFCKQLINANKSGRIVNISSNAAYAKYPSQIAYSVAKTGVISLTKLMAYELADYGINVNAICPGCVRTQMLLDIANNISLEKRMSYEEALNGLKLPNIDRFIECEEIGRLVKFLISEEAEIINGQSIVADAGLT